MFFKIFLLCFAGSQLVAAGVGPGTQDLPPPVIPEPRQSVPCNVIFDFSQTNSSAILRSPEYPNPYPANLNCRYTISSPPGTKMTMKCEDFNVEPSASCAYDAFYMSLSGDPAFSDKVFACGKGVLEKATTSNKLELGFTTDAANPSTGGPYRYQCTISVSGNPTTAAAPAAAATTTPTCNCGLRNENTRIVGGSPANKNEFTWRVGLYSPNLGVFCGGTIITPTSVLTAAHCTNALSKADTLYVNAGDHDLSTTTETDNKVVKVVKIIQHANYNNKTQNNDVSLLKLETALPFGRTIGPACLPWNMISKTFAGETVTASGWGTMSSGGTTPKELHKVDLPVLATDECKKYYGTSVTTNMICTYNPGKDTCQGDSGGSIDYKNPANNRYYAIGVVSWGVGCAGNRQPGVYAKVGNYMDWITANTNGETFCKA